MDSLLTLHNNLNDNDTGLLFSVDASQEISKFLKIPFRHMIDNNCRNVPFCLIVRNGVAYSNITQHIRSMIHNDSPNPSSYRICSELDTFILNFLDVYCSMHYTEDTVIVDSYKAMPFSSVFTQSVTLALISIIVQHKGNSQWPIRIKTSKHEGK